MAKIWKDLFLGLSLCLAVDAHAESFESCPAKAFLIQDSVAKLYGINLATGHYQLLSDDMGTTGKINAVGFNVVDNYIYGFSSQWRTLVKIDSSYTATAMDVSGLPNTTFYVGDVSLQDNAYYAYRRGESFGLYRIDLDEGSSQYLNAQRIVDGDSLNLKIYDFAFHPNNGFLYGVDSSGVLHKINADTGESFALGHVGESGTFGAVYFDSDERFYISRNSDGQVFRINLDDESPSAELFAFGPSSGNNDGARCATASIVDESVAIDFGNAPSSYGSDIGTNGARHGLSEGLYLGQSWGEPPDSTTLVTGFDVGLDSTLVVEVTGSGYISAWADWDLSGDFSDSEQIIVDYSVSTGSHVIRIAVPDDAQAGDSWIRIRYSSTEGLGPLGGVSTGEVEDYAITINNEPLIQSDYPSSKGFVTVAFEDSWPELGDYDMNDVVVSIRTTKYVNSESLVRRYSVQGKVLALGGGYHNGFAIQLDGIATSLIDTDRSYLLINGVKQVASFLEANNDEDDAVLIISEDLKSALPLSSDCAYYRTEAHCQSFEGNSEFNFSLSIVLSEGVTESLAPTGVLNPFIFASPGIYHGDSFFLPPGRSLEIHLKNKSVTTRFDESFYGLADDFSNGVQTFVTNTYMPWALQVPILWAHPKEKMDISESYPGFKQFVESNGVQSATWYLLGQADETKIIENNE